MIVTAEIRDAAAHPYRARPRLRRHRRGVFRSPLAAVAAFASLRFRSSASRLARRRCPLRLARRLLCLAPRSSSSRRTRSTTTILPALRCDILLGQPQSSSSRCLASSPPAPVSAQRQCGVQEERAALQGAQVRLDKATGSQPGCSPGPSVPFARLYAVTGLQPGHHGGRAALDPRLGGGAGAALGRGAGAGPARSGHGPGGDAAQR